jgi:colicin import membrane protein
MLLISSSPGDPVESTMSTVPDRSKASFRYGYRQVREKLPDGRSRWKRVPLTLEDVLHPRFEDVHMLGDPHSEDCMYLRAVVKARHADDPSAVVLTDCGVYWDIPGLKHHSPDLAVIFGVKQRKAWKTFHVRKEGVRPSLIVEVTSPKTRVVDVKTKVEQYARARVPHYVIADSREVDGKRRIELIAYRLKGEAYERVPLDARGRAWLAPVRLWLGVKVDPETGDDRVVLIDPITDREIGDYTAMDRARGEAEARAAAEAEARAAEAEARAAEAEARAAEAEARAAAEARVRELEAELKRLRGRKRR